MTAQIQQLTSELTLEHINEIPVLTLNHPVGSADVYKRQRQANDKLGELD